MTPAYTVFWPGKPKREKRDSGVGFAIRIFMVDKVAQPCSINDRIMKLCLPLAGDRYISPLNLCCNSKVENMTFYATLGDAIRSIPKEEELIALGEFNAKVGKRHETSGLSVPMALKK